MISRITAKTHSSTFAVTGFGLSAGKIAKMTAVSGDATCVTIDVSGALNWLTMTFPAFVHAKAAAALELCRAAFARFTAPFTGRLATLIYPHSSSKYR